MFLDKHVVLSLLPVIVAEKNVLPNYVHFLKCILEKEGIITRNQTVFFIVDGNEVKS